MDKPSGYSLLLNIGGRLWESPRFSLDGNPTDVNWLDAPNSVLSVKYFSNDVLISALVRGPYEGCGFRLRIPYGGDQKKWLTKVDDDGRMYMMKNGQRAYSVQVLHQAVGIYTLVLESEGDDGEYKSVLNIPIEVETDDLRLDIVNGMVDEILAFDHLPFQVLTQDTATVWGRIKMFYSDNSRMSEREVPWSRFEALKRLRERLAPLLSVILAQGASRLGCKDMFCRVRDVHRFDRLIIRQIARRGAANYVSPTVQSLTVRTKEPMPSRNIPAHHVIRDFLEMCARECVAVLNRLIRDLGEANIGDVRKRQLGLQKAEFDRRVLPFFDRNLREINSWCQGRGVVSIEDADPSWFDISEEYKKLYWMMLRYRTVMKGRRIESGLFSNVDYRRMESGEPSTLQKRYDFIYEAWCYLRMVKAFIALGFYEIESSYYDALVSDDGNEEYFLPHEMINRPLRARKGNLTVMLYYRVRAETSSNARFYLPPTKGGARQLLEPDYLIIFTMDGVEEGYEIIMDAKAMLEVGDRERKKRDDYLLRFDVNDYHHFSNQIKKPKQSWLIYMGGGYDAAKIFFSESGEDDLDKMNKGSAFSANPHALEQFDFANQHAGHLRVNARAVDDGDGGDIFTMWASIQVKIAEKFLAQKL